MKKILIAEDNDSNFILMTYILKKYYQFERAKNGQEAVEMAEKNTYDIVLMDIKMPIMDGLEATKAIKEKFPDLPIIALTATLSTATVSWHWRQDVMTSSPSP